MKRTKTDWTPKPAEDIMTMFSIFTHSKTAMEIYEKIGLYKFYRIHKALWSLEKAGKLLAFRNELHFKVYRRFDAGW